MNVNHLIDALKYIAARKCDCAKAAKEAPPCSHVMAKKALAQHQRFNSLEKTPAARSVPTPERGRRR